LDQRPLDSGQISRRHYPHGGGIALQAIKMAESRALLQELHFAAQFSPFPVGALRYGSHDLEQAMATVKRV
jgi:hypothetical protein